MATSPNAKDRQYSLQLTRWFLKYLGVWLLVSPDSEDTPVILSYLQIAFNIMAIVFTLIPTVLHVLLQVEDMGTIIVLLGPISFSSSNMIKYFFVIIRRNIIKDCFEHMKVDWESIEMEDDRKSMIENALFSRKLTQGVGSLMVTSVLLYHAILPLFWEKSLDQFNRTIKPLAYPGNDLYMNTQSSSTYEIMYAVYIVCGLVLFSVMTGICNLAATLTSHVFGQIAVLELRLRDLLQPSTVKNLSIQDKLSFIIKSHARILKFGNNIEKVLHEICFVEVVASTLIICLLEYYCMTEWRNSDTVAIITYVMLLMSLSFNIFIFCFIGDKLERKCESMAMSTYKSDWYKIPGRGAHPLILTIAASNSPPRITAGGMMKLNIPNFASIIKTSVIYLNVLRTVTD